MEGMDETAIVRGVPVALDGRCIYRAQMIARLNPPPKNALFLRVFRRTIK
jgi:hypothetical protein